MSASASTNHAAGSSIGRATTADPVLVDDLVVANRILFHQGVVDGFGHVSVRHDKHPNRFLLARNMAPGQVTAADIMEFDLSGEALRGDDRRPYLERFIHGEILRAKPELTAVVHSHSASVVPFGVVKNQPLRPVFHMSGFLRGATPVFEIRDVAGDASDLLIRDRALGVALARSLGSASVVLMRGHGSTAVGASLRQAVFRAVYTEINARLQSDALKLGSVTYLTEGEADSAAATNNGQLDRAWNLWKTLAQEVSPRSGGGIGTSGP